MSGKGFILVVYDISNDKRRTKLHNALLDFGTPVQYSVFECFLDEKEQERMKRKVMGTIRPKIDHVRFYPICAECLRQVETTAGKEVLCEDNRAIIVG
ncbi:MAG: CRISPR-associated endonuclease Cas2 [Chloroflexota bacterium]